MKDIRQSVKFASFMKDINWKIDKLGNNFIYIKKLPIIGYFIKIPRPRGSLSFNELKNIIDIYNPFTLKISPFLKINSPNYPDYKKHLQKFHFRIDASPFNPTTTRQINLSQNLDMIFNSFTSAKRRGVRKAIKNNVIVKSSPDIKAFIKIRQQQYRPLGFLVKNEMRVFWRSFHPKNATLLLTYKNAGGKKERKAIAGILLLFFDKICYYWFASSLDIGKKLFAPTLLVWMALKEAKAKKCRVFDFEGISDERFPKASSSWHGFTKFKNGFGGKTVVFSENFVYSKYLNWVI